MTTAYFLINLDRHPDRRAHMEAQAAATGIAVQRLRAANGTDMPFWLRGQFLRPDGSINSSLMPGEVGCYASHLIACHRLLYSGAHQAVILEDDIHLPPNFEAFIDAVLETLPKGWDVVRLSSRSPLASLGIAHLPEGRSLVRYNRHPLLTGATLVSRSGAYKLLMHGKRIRPIDVEYRYPWIIGLDVYGVEPAIVDQPLRLFISTIIGDGKYTDTWRLQGRIEASERMAGIAYRLRTVGPPGWIACNIAGLVARIRYRNAKKRARAQGRILERPCMPVIHLRSMKKPLPQTSSDSAQKNPQSQTKASAPVHREANL